MRIVAYVLGLVLMASVIGVTPHDASPVLAAATGTPTPDTPPGDWSTFKGNAARDGRADAGPVGEPVQRWRVQASGPVDSPPAVVDRVVYVGSGDGLVHAIDAATGQERWQFTADAAVGGAPTVADGAVFVADAAGTLSALETATGQERWRLADPIATASTPAVVGKLLYIGTEDGALLAIDTTSGDERWRVAVADQGAVFTPAVADGVVYVGSETGGFVAVDAVTGEARWRGETGEDALGTAVVADGIAYIGGSGSGGAGHLSAFDAASGTLRWRLDEALYSPAVADGVAYSASVAGTFAALDPATGQDRWRIELPGPLRPPAIAKGILYVPSDGDHAVYALDAATGTQLWRVAADGGIGGIAVDDGSAYVGTLLGSVYAIGGTGDTGQAATASPVVATPAEATPVASAAVPAIEVLWETHGGETALVAPYGVALDPDGNLWVADAHNQFQIFAPDGTYLETWGTPGADEGQLNLTLPNGDPVGSVTFGPDGSFYIDDTSNSRIQQFDRDRQFVAAWQGTGGTFQPRSIAIDASGQLYVIDSANDTVDILDRDLTPLRSFRIHEALGISPEQARDALNFIALDDTGTISVSSALRASILTFAPDGTFLGEISGPGVGDGKFGQPVDIAFDAAGNLWVPDFNNGVIEVFTPDGTPLTTVGSFGRGPGQFAGPAGIVIDGDTLYVSELDTNRVQAFHLVTPGS